MENCIVSLLEDMVMITLVPFCLVVICFRSVFPKRTSPKPAKPPYPLKSRVRSLSIPVQPTGTGKRRQRTNDQAQSTLLSKLPFEIREMIWKQCVGCRTVGLKIHRRRLTSLVFRRYGVQNEEEEETARQHFNGFSKKKAKKAQYKPQILQILLTCRQVYSEAIPYLYSANYFATMFPETILHLPCLLLPQRLSLIRSLGFVWDIKEVPLVRHGQVGKVQYTEQWTEVWKRIGEMEGLRDLLVALPIHPELQDEWKREELLLLQPVKTVTTPKLFVIIVPFQSIFRERDFRQFPCSICRRPGLEVED